MKALEPVSRGQRKYRVIVLALVMDFVLAILMLLACWHADVLSETLTSIVTLWLTASGTQLTIFVGGNVATHKVQAEESA